MFPLLSTAIPWGDLRGNCPSALPEDLRQVSFYGLYVKQTESFFAPVRIVEAD